MEDYFKLLGVESHAGDREIRQAFCEKIKALHPDTGQYNRQEFDRVMTAYRVLSVKPLRKAYLARLVRQKVQQTLNRNPVAVIPPSRLVFPNRLEMILNRIKVFDKKRYHEVAREFTEDLIVLLTPDESRNPFEFLMDLPLRKRCPLCGGVLSDCALCEGRGAVGGSAPYRIQIQGPVVFNEVKEIEVQGRPFSGAHYLIKKLKIRFLLFNSVAEKGLE